MKASKINKLDNFIAGWYINKKVCNDFIDYFEESPFKYPGVIGNKNGLTVDIKKKHSTDLSINVRDINNDIRVTNYLKQLSLVLQKYKKKYKYCSEQHPSWSIVENFNIQRYKPKEGFFKFHTEKSSIKDSLRHLVFMTYLNDVTDGGETEFYHQKLKVKPEKGLTLIWPTDWTFRHRGLTSETQTKYIATGWYSYNNG